MKTAITDFGLQVNFIEQAHLPTENLGIMRLKCTSLCAFLGTLLSWLSNYLTGHFSSFLYWFFVLFLNSTMFGEYCSSVLGLILFFFLLISTLYSLSLWMISASTLIATYQLLTQIFISSQYPSPALQLLIFNLLFGIHFDV